MTNSYRVILMFIFMVSALTIEIPFSLGKTSCMALMCSFDVFFANAAYKSGFAPPNSP